MEKKRVKEREKREEGRKAEWGEFNQITVESNNSLIIQLVVFAHLVSFLNSSPIKKNGFQVRDCHGNISIEQATAHPDLIMLCEKLSSDVRTFPCWVIFYLFFLKFNLCGS